MPRNKKHTKKRKKKKRQLVIGMISVPLTPGKKYYQVCGDSYIASSHISWLKRFGIKILPIPYNTKDFKGYIQKINGLYFPSGGAFAGTQTEYYECCKKFVQLAKKENDKGNHFPIWGGCMGMQQLLIIADGHDDLKKLLQRFDSFNNLNSTLKFTEEGLNSKIMRRATKAEINKLSKKKCTLNNHKMGITPAKFKKHKNIDKFYKIVSTSKDRKGRAYVSTIEGRFYPFYGVQWHPERSSAMDYFAKFFVNELKKNHTKNKKSTRKIYTKEIDCFNYSNSLYKRCRFYWHKRTSKHNKKLCSVAQLLKNEKKKNKGKKLPKGKIFTGGV
jgi:gamma-glutamyl-gamma-aminobutyrate hydrolase PuuD